MPNGDGGPRHFAGARDAPVFGNPEVHGRLRDVFARHARAASTPPPASRYPGTRVGDRTEMATAPHGAGKHDDDRDFFKVKRIDFLGSKRAIVCQNENGPCPLIGIVNVLLLRNAVTLQGAPDVPEVSAQELMSLVAARILDENARGGAGGRTGDDAAKGDDFEAMDAEQAEAMRQNQEQNVSDAMAALPSLATGLDVNVRFRHALDFEFTAELAIFDLLDITLCHAWVADPAHHPEAAAAIGARGYNQLMERVIELTCAAEETQAEAEAEASRRESGSVAAPGGFDATMEGRDADEPPEAPSTRMNRSRSEEEMVRRAMQLSLEEANRGNEEEDVVAAIVSELVTRAANASEEYKHKDGCESSRRESSAVFGNVLAERYVLDDFLASSASQLTKGGLASALAKVKERELVVFFRNNHFSTAFKLNGVLYNLVTDLGYLGEPDVVWEVLANPPGGNEGGTKGGDAGERRRPAEGTFVDGGFNAFTPHLDPSGSMGVTAGVTAGVSTEEDAQMAAALLASVRDVRGGPGEGPPITGHAESSSSLPGDFLRAPNSPSERRTAAPDADYALAVQLQAEYEEEARRAEEARRRSRAEAERSRAVAEAERSRAAAEAAKKKKKKKASSSYGSDCVVM